MWHIDGHHKLIRYGLITHGGVDGCSRAITYMRLNNNNTTATALSSYQFGVAEYQVPDRIQFFMDLFSSLERDGMVIHNPYHMALQHLFMPRIQQEIDQFRTRHNRSPNQLLMLYSDITAPSCD